MAGPATGSGGSSIWHLTAAAAQSPKLHGGIQAADWPRPAKVSLRRDQALRQASGEPGRLFATCDRRSRILQSQGGSSLGQPRPASASLGQPRPYVPDGRPYRPCLATRPCSRILQKKPEIMPESKSRAPSFRTLPESHRSDAAASSALVMVDVQVCTAQTATTSHDESATPARAIETGAEFSSRG